MKSERGEKLHRQSSLECVEVEGEVHEREPKVAKRYELCVS